MSMHTPYLTDDQVYQLNEKHGWFQFGDAQSDVSRAFASDAIAMHERIRSAAQELLHVSQMVMDAFASFERYGETCQFEGQPMIHASTLEELADEARKAIAKATGERPMT